MLGTQAVADVGGSLGKVDVLVDKRLVVGLVLDDVVGDVIEYRQVGLRHEHHVVVAQIEAAMLESRQHVHLAAFPGETRIGEARPQDRVHLGHVGAPQHEHIGVLQVVITAHRLIRAEAADEGRHGGGHAVARIGIDVVGAETGLVQLGGGIALEHGPLAGAEHAHTGTEFLRRLALVGFHVLLERGLELFRHDVERLVPADRSELALLVVLAVAHAQQGLGQTVLAIHDLGQEITLDTVQTPIDRRIRITLGGDHAAVLGADQHAAAGATETARRLVPANHFGRFCQYVLNARNGDARRRRGGGNRIGLNEISPGQFHH